MANLDTLEDVIIDIKDRFDDQSSDTDTSARRWVNQIMMDIWTRNHWKFARKVGTVTTAASTEGYSLASDYDFGGLYDVRDTTNDHKLHPVPDQDFDLVYPDPTTTGQPLYYRLWGVDSDKLQTIQLYPIPAGVYTIKYRYYYVPSNMTTSTETPPIPNKYRELLVLGALALLYEKNQNSQSTLQWSKFNNKLVDMIAEYSEEPGYIPVLDTMDSQRTSIPVVQYPADYPE